MTEEDIVNPLFYLLRQKDDSCLGNPLDQLSSGDWDELMSTSLRLGVAPLLYDRIKRKSFIDQVQVEFMDALKLAYHNNAAQNLIVRKQLEEILFILETHQIPIILLKGSVLAFTIYDNPACRVMSDLDILVHETDIPKVLTSFEQIGYQMSKPAWETPGHHLPALVKPGVCLPVEVHWQLISPGRAKSISSEESLASAHSSMLFGHPFFELSPTLTLFHNCQHTAYQHRFANGARGLCDIESITRFYNEKINWEMFMSMTEKTSSTRGILLLLKLSDKLLSVSLPAEIKERIATENIPDTMVSAARDRIFIGEEMPDSPPDKFIPVFKWCLIKAQKLLHLFRDTGSQKHESSETGKGQSLFWIRRLLYLKKIYWEAAIYLLTSGKESLEAKKNKELRSWLDIR